MSVTRNTKSIGLCDELITLKLKEHSDYKVLPERPKYDRRCKTYNRDIEQWISDNYNLIDSNLRLRIKIWTDLCILNKKL